MALQDLKQRVFDFAQQENIRLFILYVVFAGIATVVDLGLLFILTEFAKIWYLFSSIISSIMGMVTNYSLNKYYNFRDRRRDIVRQFGVFASVAIVGIFLNQLILFILVEFAGLWYMFARMIAIVVVMFWSFFGHKKITFRKREEVEVQE
jgi:putative flippase GtrA